MIRKICKAIVLAVALYLSYVFLVPHTYSVDKAVAYVNEPSMLPSRTS